MKPADMTLHVIARALVTAAAASGLFLALGACSPAAPPAAAMPSAQRTQSEAPARPTSAPSGALAIEYPCRSDAQCLAHHCNLERGVCYWPCQSDSQCQSGYHCATPACVPDPDEP